MVKITENEVYLFIWYPDWKTKEDIQMDIAAFYGKRGLWFWERYEVNRCIERLLEQKKIAQTPSSASIWNDVEYPEMVYRRVIKVPQEEGGLEKTASYISLKGKW